MTTLFEKFESFHTELSPAKVARKYKLLQENPFRFFRGTNQLFYEDLSRERLPHSPVCWICGDLHIENFGSYKGDNRLVYFDINDFDESMLAPVIWDVIRAVTSIQVAFDSLKITDKEALKACEIFLNKYTQILAEGNPRYIETRTATGIIKRFLNLAEQSNDKTLLASRTIKKNGGLKLSEGKNKQLIIDDSLKKKLIEAIENWMKSNNESFNGYKVLDVRFRLAGTGSMGIKRYVFLLQKIKNGKHRLVDMKQAQPSSLKPYNNISQPEWISEAHRMVAIQKIMQNIPPAQLSTISFEGEEYLIQEMQPTKDRINFKMIENNFKLVSAVIEDMGMITASAHLRGVGRKGSCSADELMLFGQDKLWHKDVINYATTYKERIINYFNDFKKEIKSIKNKNK